MREEPLDYCYHTHTKRCGHAKGEDEEYVKKALEGGYQVLGFSDHIMLPGHSQAGMRGDYALEAGYFSSIHALQKKYQGRIAIHLGYEAEWYGEAFAGHYHDLLTKQGLEYMILGQHCFLQDGQLVFYGNLPDKQEATRRYASDLIAGIKSQDFLYVAHPDLFLSWHEQWDLKAEEASRAIIAAALDAGIPLEVNMGNSRWGANLIPGGGLEVTYPNPRFWEMAQEAGAKTIVGVDAHAPDQLTASPFDWLRAFLAKERLTPLTRLPALDGPKPLRKSR